jgi:NADPH:quinone reductase-like Zn-dependent oxidoreductase
LAEPAKLVDTGQVTVHLDRVFPLTEARQAHEQLETQHSQGKVVLSVERVT